MRTRGFTLIELMMVIAMLGVIAAMSIANYRVFTARAKRTEAYTLLRHVQAIQEEYKGIHGVYAGTFDQLVFSLRGGSKVSETEWQAKYYSLNLSQPGGPETYYCSATGEIDGDEWLDVLVVEAW